MAKNVLVLKHFESPKEAGVYYRLVCLTGGNKGESYVLLGNRVVIGRGDRVDIKLNDTKASREHAEITKVGENWVVTDLGSQNGVMINEHKITQQQINESDKLIIGQTVFKFAKVEVASKNKVIKETAEDAKKKTMVPVMILASVFAMIFLFDESDKPTTQRNPGKSNYVNVDNEYQRHLDQKRVKEDKQVKEKMNAIYQRGLRELREKNYFRAIHEFNLALIIAPGDSQAEYYLRKTKEELDREIEGFTAKAQRDQESLKYQGAIVSYCSIIRLLYTVPDDPRHKNAVEKINDIEEILGLVKGETYCLKKQRTAQ
ncbi:FHA domain-containing protein [Peredibacter starrii]|uniref:FHA domain-containing protein n=1 Tax=Peredibacter starrii TaxID=28202 RepID=A0AAX4HQI7_9BACT|nr:FHA domain-containing protein [Peredibacter starrii]WPU65199.1 FHA domain-containing protein [Peredibacter starrii]